MLLLTHYLPAALKELREMPLRVPMLQLLHESPDSAEQISEEPWDKALSSVSCVINVPDGETIQLSPLHAGVGDASEQALADYDRSGLLQLEWLGAMLTMLTAALHLPTVPLFS